MKIKRFFTLFPFLRNVHLLKDVGMIPYCMYRDYGYDATLVCFRNEEKYPALEKEVKGLKIEFLEKEENYAIGKVSWKVMGYLWKHAKEIDILNLYHATKETLAYAMLYKILNPDGLLYIKLDVDIRTFDKQKRQMIHPLRIAGYNCFFKHIPDIVSCELPSAQSYLISEIPTLKDKLELITNGIDDVYIWEKDICILPFSQKEKLIITVGRIGSPPKNTAFLLRAIEQIDLRDWKVALIGPVEEHFLPELTRFFFRNPHLKDKVICTGNIMDKKELYDWYNKARVFCLTSSYESFGIVFSEALFFGNYIITTDVSPASYVTAGGQTGTIIRNTQELANLLRELIMGIRDISEYYNTILKYSEKFRWKSNLKILDERLKNLSATK